MGITACPLDRNGKEKTLDTNKRFTRRSVLSATRLGLFECSTTALRSFPLRYRPPIARDYSPRSPEVRPRRYSTRCSSQGDDARGGTSLCNDTAPAPNAVTIFPPNGNTRESNVGQPCVFVDGHLRTAATRTTMERTARRFLRERKTRSYETRHRCSIS